MKSAELAAPQRLTIPRPERIAESVTHGAAALAAIYGVIELFSLATLRGGTAPQIVSLTIYSISVVLLLGASSIYHALIDTRWKSSLRLIDHLSIYLHMAGTYTPFAILGLHGGFATIMIAMIWITTALGILYKLFLYKRYPRVSTPLYVIQGWSFVIAFPALVQNGYSLPALLLLVGGIFYSAGVYFYSHDRKPWFHTIWHFFVIAGCTAHWTAIYCLIDRLPVL